MNKTTPETMPKKVLITRPKQDARGLAFQLDQYNIESLIEPMLEIVPRENNHQEIHRLLAKNPQAFLVTSANGVRSLAEMCPRRDICLVVVGPITESVARKYGFSNIRNAGTRFGANVELLADYVRRSFSSTKGMLVHVGGSVVAGKLQLWLQRDGFSVERLTLYDAIEVTELSIEAQTAISNEQLGAVIFYSLRTAETFNTLLKKHQLTEKASCIAAINFSHQIGAMLKECDIPYATIKVAAHPNQAEVTSCLLKHFNLTKKAS